MKRQLILFKIGSGEFATDILMVKEITLTQEVTPVPGTPDIVAGVLNLRGSLIPVLDLRRRLRLRATTISEQPRILIALLNEKRIGLYVDRASDFIRVDETQIEPVPAMLQEIGAHYITGVLRYENRLIALMDLPCALGREALSQLDEVVAALAQTSDSSQKQAAGGER